MNHLVRMSLCMFVLSVTLLKPFILLLLMKNFKIWNQTKKIKCRLITEKSFYVVFRIRIRLDPFHFSQPDPDPLQ